MSNVYLAGSIEGVSDADANDWRERLTKRLLAKGQIVVNPYKFVALPARELEGWEKKRVVELCRAAIDECTIVLANLSGAGRAVGTCREIEFAVQQNKKVIVLIEGEPAWFLHDTEIVRSEDEAVNAVVAA